MAEQIYSKALTTVQRVKDRMQITASEHDVELARMINAVTDWIEKYCDRKFVLNTYTEKHSPNISGSNIIFLRNYPALAIDMVQYATGLPSNKQWTDYTDDEYELENDGEMGILHIYGSIPKGTNTISVTYTAGYATDWDKAGDPVIHPLPADLTDLAERMTVKLFKRRNNDGRDSEGFDGGTITWEKQLPQVDMETLNRYRRIVFA